MALRKILIYSIFFWLRNWDSPLGPIQCNCQWRQGPIAQLRLVPGIQRPWKLFVQPGCVWTRHNFLSLISKSFSKEPKCWPMFDFLSPLIVKGGIYLFHKLPNMFLSPYPPPNFYIHCNVSWNYFFFSTWSSLFLSTLEMVFTMHTF